MTNRIHVTFDDAATSTTYGVIQIAGDLSGTAAAPTVPNKQDKLVSATNIKTINGLSILGSGNISITGGGAGWDGTRTDNNGNVWQITVDTDGSLRTTLTSSPSSYGATYGSTY